MALYRWTALLIHKQWNEDMIVQSGKTPYGQPSVEHMGRNAIGNRTGIPDTRDKISNSLFGLKCNFLNRSSDFPGAS